MSSFLVFAMAFLEVLLQQGDGNIGSGRVADPVSEDGMRAPPGTEADVGMRRASARPWALTHLSSSSLSMSKSKIPAEVVVEITGVNELEIVEVGEL